MHPYRPLPSTRTVTPADLRRLLQVGLGFYLVAQGAWMVTADLVGHAAVGGPDSPVSSAFMILCGLMFLAAGRGAWRSAWVRVASELAGWTVLVVWIEGVAKGIHDLKLRAGGDTPMPTLWVWMGHQLPLMVALACGALGLAWAHWPQRAKARPPPPGGARASPTPM